MNVPARAGILTLLAYIATIPAANLAVTHFGVVPVGLGYTAPAGVYMVGLALILRDLVREAAGRGAVLTAIAIGTLLSYLLADPNLATASAIAFAVAELMDFGVYEPLRQRGLLLAMLADGPANGHPASASGPGVTARSAPTAHQSTEHPDQRPADPSETA
ncbi:hypothetical protein [Streptomyces olivaceus]|uniref:hypothetical protein n=1 Tax=Streptomyces olivaceus TaxID=47716 RepID=UPI0036C19A9D